MSAKVACLIASTPRKLEMLKMIHAFASSFSGLSHAETYGGHAAIMSDSRLKPKPRFDSPKYCHRSIATPDSVIQTLSRVFQPGSP